MAFIVVAYDICSDRRRSKLHKRLKDYGEPVQYSVFECNLRPRQRRSLVRVIEENTSRKEDRVRIYELCKECKKKAAVMGEGGITEDSDSLFV